MTPAGTYGKQMTLTVKIGITSNSMDLNNQSTVDARRPMCLSAFTVNAKNTNMMYSAFVCDVSVKPKHLQ